ncbi:MAG TPA: phosphotransferase family protein [Rhizomicrobium sp.]|nr:phosphotransferase family protein [Rhizomicrobium sp.]
MNAAGLGFDPAPLETYLRAALPQADGTVRLERVEGGQSNPTFFVDLGNLRLVLRKQPAGALLPSAHAIDREFRIQKALAQTGFPVPEMLFYCEDRAIIGTPFYVMRRVEGRCFHDCAMPGLSPEQRGHGYRALALALARLHNAPFAEIGLGDYGRVGGYYVRQLARWTKQWSLSKTRDDSHIEALIAWLGANMPADDVTTIAHGDYRVGNVLLNRAPLEVSAVLDWELSSLGHPLADLAHFCIAWQSRPQDYGGLRGVDLARLGIPEQQAFEETYYQQAGHGLRMSAFHMVFALFRFAVIFEGIVARAKAGNAAGRDTSQAAGIAAAFAHRAMEILEQA